MCRMARAGIALGTAPTNLPLTATTSQWPARGHLRLQLAVAHCVRQRAPRGAQNASGSVQNTSRVAPPPIRRPPLISSAIEILRFLQVALFWHATPAAAEQSANC